MIRKTAIICILISSIFTISADTIKEAFDLLKANKRTDAYTKLNNLKTGNEAKEALLGMVLINLNNRNYNVAFENFKEFCTNNKDAEPYIYSLWTSGIFTQIDEAKQKDVMSFMTDLATKTTTNVTIKAMANNYIGEQLMYNRKPYIPEFNKISDLNNWASVGDFENMSGSGFNKDYGVLQHPEAEYTFKNKINADVKWFDIPCYRFDKWMDNEYYYQVDNSLIYSQTFLFSDTDKEMIMMAGVSGSIKIWINDVLVFNEKEERNTDFDLYQFKIKLQKGYNRVLLQTGSSEIDKNNFSIRLKNLDGTLLQNPVSQAKKTTYPKATEYTSEPIKFWAEKFFEENLKNSKNEFIDLYMLMQVYNHNDKSYEARKIASKLKKNAPLCTISNEELCEAYARDKNQTDRDKEYEFIKNEDPNSFIALTLKMQEAQEIEDYDKVSETLDKLCSLYGNNQNTDALRIELYSNKKETRQMIEAIESGYVKYPESRYYTMMKFRLEKSYNSNLKSALKILENFNKKYFNESVISTLSYTYFEKGDHEKGMAMIKTLYDTYPYSASYAADIAEKYNDKMNYNEAIVWQNKAIKLAPYIGAMYLPKARYLETQNKLKEAEEVYEKALYYTPTLSSARKKLTDLRGKKDIFDYFKTYDIDKIIKDAPDAAKYPEDNSLFLISDIQHVVFPENGVSEEKHHYLIKVLNQGGLDAWKEINIPVLGSQKLILEKAELYKNGSNNKVQAETNYSQLVFSTLEVGDIIHIYYKLETNNYGKLAEHFWEDNSLNGYYPFLESRFSIIVPKNRKFQYKTYNTNIEPIKTDVDNDNSLYVWERYNTKAIKSEPYMPAFNDIAERVVVTSIPDWNYVANWYSDLSGIKTKADYEVKEKVTELFEGKGQMSDLEKAKTIYKYIQENFSYSNVDFLHSALTPQSASRTLRTKLGDCKDLSTLFVAMCKEIGLDANLILVDTRDNGDKNLELPSIGFNHCIAQFKTKDKNYIIEMTNNYLPFGAMSSDLINTNGLYIPKEGIVANNVQLSKLNTKNRPKNMVVRKATVVLNGENAVVSRSSSRTGVQTSGIRYDYKNLGEEDRKKHLLNSISSDFNKNVKLNTMKFKNLENLDDTLFFEYNFTLEKFVSTLVGMKVFTLPWADSYGSQNFVSEDTRKYDFNLWEFSSSPTDKETIELTIPAGKALAEIPQNIKLEGPGIDYSLTYEIKPGKLIATRIVNYKTEIIPAKDYLKFKDFITKVNEQDTKQYALK
jgi:hypothetical protein